MPPVESSPRPRQPPRPPNSWIVFRSHKMKELADVYRRSGKAVPGQGDLSREIAAMWKALKPDERAVWDGKAEAQKAEHARQYPDYKYRPKKKDDPVRKARKSDQRDGSSASTSPPAATLLIPLPPPTIGIFHAVDPDDLGPTPPPSLCPSPPSSPTRLIQPLSAASPVLNIPRHPLGYPISEDGSLPLLPYPYCGFIPSLGESQNMLDNSIVGLNPAASNAIQSWFDGETDPEARNAFTSLMNHGYSHSMWHLDIQPTLDEQPLEISFGQYEINPTGALPPLTEATSTLEIYDPSETDTQFQLHAPLNDETIEVSESSSPELPTGSSYKPPAGAHTSSIRRVAGSWGRTPPASS